MSRMLSHPGHWTSATCGHAGVFIAAVVIVVVWAAIGPLFRYSGTWRLIIEGIGRQWRWPNLTPQRGATGCVNEQPK
jgi:hypothetical protein